ncbi:hypothetical protein [Paracidovorax wautersii]|uniref:Metal-dependent hydrolase, beta-lactamase superfamily II n=1 Tax=Paracidovorax wautersii TaxID=1177982 RepID=A0A1I2H4B6_9BURK|nr:hypothetical protein [Paracidovorax wautersii]SFF24378.1 hypothetical protein SAMN04489711_11931 [Paracidovorax wautersii]
MATQNNALYADCPYLHYDPRLGRRVLANHRYGGFRVLARLLSITGPAEGGEPRSEDGAKASIATFEVIGADWAMDWLELSYRDWINDVKGKPTYGQVTLGNAQIGRFTYQPSGARWHMMLLNASLGGGLATPDDALRRWRQGITPDWFQARVTVGKMADIPFCRVTYFASIFDAGLPAAIDAVKALSKTSLAKAGRRFRMPAILKQAARRAGARLTKHGLWAEHLAVYDVGQGAAQALVRLDQSHVTPELYIDMGCGRNHALDAALPGLRFCTSASPPVILSHADEDHWCGAVTKAMATAGYPAHKLEWTAPATTGSAAFMTFAHSVWAQGGSVRTLDLTGPPPNTITATTKTGKLLIAQGASKQFNHSGLIVAVVRQDNQHYWLLPGDCDYHFFPATLKSMAITPCCVALTAFHHGAKPTTQVAIPRAVGGDYRRLVYSFGCGNDYGHPTLHATAGHHAAGWIHDAGWLAKPGLSLPGGGSCARATAWTPVAPPPYTHAGGVLIGWSIAPTLPPAAVCCHSGCRAVVPAQV